MGVFLVSLERSFLLGKCINVEMKGSWVVILEQEADDKREREEN